MSRGSRILCVGAAHWDLIGRSDAKLGIGDDTPGAVERRLGGVALNISVGLAARQCLVSLCAVVGDDEAGSALIRKVQAQGIACADVLRIAGAATGHYVAIEDRSGDLFAAVADAHLLDDHADALTGQAISALGTTDALLLEANLATCTLRDVAEAALAANVEIIANPVSPAKAPRLEFLLSGAFAPTIVTNLAEANALMQESLETTREAALALRDRCSGTSVVTAGAHSVSLAGPDEIITLTPPEVPGNASVTGAGDALLAGFLASPDRRKSPRSALNQALAAAADHMKASTRR